MAPNAQVCLIFFTIVLNMMDYFFKIVLNKMNIISKLCYYYCYHQIMISRYLKYIQLFSSTVEDNSSESNQNFIWNCVAFSKNYCQQGVSLHLTQLTELHSGVRNVFKSKWNNFFSENILKVYKDSLWHNYYKDL